MKRDNLTVVELLIQLLQGAKEARKVLYKYSEIPRLKKLNVTLSTAKGKETGGEAKLYVGFKRSKKSDYNLTKTYNYRFDEEEVFALNLNTKGLFATFDVDLQTGIPALSEEGNKEINQIFNIDYSLLESEYGRYWDLQTKNLSLDFASALVRHAADLYHSASEVPGVSIGPFKYEETFVITNTKKVGIYLEFFGATLDASKEWKNSVTHTFEAIFTDEK